MLNEETDRSARDLTDFTAHSQHEPRPGVEDSSTRRLSKAERQKKDFKARWPQGQRMCTRDLGQRQLLPPTSLTEGISVKVKAAMLATIKQGAPVMVCGSWQQSPNNSHPTQQGPDHAGIAERSGKLDIANAHGPIVC